MAEYRLVTFYHAPQSRAIAGRLFKREPIPSMAPAYGDFDHLLGVVANAVAVGPYPSGQQFTIAAAVAGSQLQRGMMTGALSPRAAITAYIDRLKQRPALARVHTRDANLVAAGYASA